jgi:hypothetical protein
MDKHLSKDPTRGHRKLMKRRWLEKQAYGTIDKGSAINILNFGFSKDN